ncbi:MAG: hypothetical protein MJ182_05320 [Treponema sp.]|nr:hypothetical protein [Treponema sp.]
MVPLYTEDEYNWIKPSPGTYAFYSLNSSFNTSSEAVLNSLLAVYDVSILTSEGNNYESVTNASLKFRLINETDSNLTISPVSVFKKTVNFVSSSESSISPSGEVKTLSSNGVQFSINAIDQYAISAVLIKDASENVLCRYEMARKTFVPENLFLVNNSGENIVSIKNAKLESNLSKFSGTLFVEESNSQTISIVVETKIRPFIQSTDPYSFEKDVMRTAPITIRFSKPMKSFGADSTAYLNYFNVMRCDNAGVLNGNGENVFQEILSGTDAHPRYFKNPELKENNYQVVISPVNNTDEPLWMKSGSEVRVSIDKTFTDEAGIPLLEDYYFTYTIGTKGDSTGPILSQEDTKLFLKGDSETPDEEIPVTIWGDFEPSDSPDPNHTYADSIHVVKDQMFKFKVSASDRDSKIKNFIAVLRLLYVPEGGNIPNAKQKAPKNLRLFDEKGNWLYEAGYLEKDFYKEIVVPYSGNDNIAISDDNLCTFDLNSFFTSDTIPLPVDGFFQIELTACDELYNRADNSVFYYFVRDTTAPRIIDNQHNISFTDDCGISYNNKRYFGKNKSSVAFRVNNETLYDFGVQEKPKIAGASDKVFWRVALATSKTVFDSTTMVSSWTSWKEASSIQKTLIPDSYFASHPEDCIIYPWISLKDENGLIRTGFCDNGQLLYIDVTSPKVPVLIDNSDEYFMNLNKDILTLNKTSVTTNWRLEDQSSIGIETYPKLVVKENSQIIEPAGYSLTVNTGKSYEIYAEDLLGNISEKIVFNALFDTTPPHVEITGLNPEYNNSFSGLLYTGDPFNQDITYEDFSFTVGVGDGFDYDLKQQSSGSSSNGRTTTYTNGKVVLDFTVTETGHGIVENGIKITNIKISSIQIDDGPEIPYDNLKIFDNEIDRYYGPYTCIPVTDGTINNNTKYRVKGELIPRKDDSDNIADGDYFVEVYVSDGLNDESSDIDSIILDTTPPELCLGNSNDTQSWYSSTDVSKILYFKQNNGEAIYNEIQSLIAFPNAVSNKNDLSSTYKAEDNGVRKAFIEIYVDSEYRYDSNNYIYYKKNNRYMYFDPKNDSTYTSINNIFPDNIISDNWTSHSVYLPSFSSEKSNSFIVKVSDIFGNSRNYYLNFYDDSEGPHLSFVSEKHTGLIKHYRNDDGVAVELERYHPENIFKSVSFYTEDGKHSFYTEDLENAFLKDYSIDSTGTVWHYVALDKVGNSYSDKITVVLDNIPPEITLKSFEGTQSSSTTQNEFLLKLDLKDSISGLNHLNLLSRHKSVKYSLNSGSSYEDIDYDYSEGIYKISFDEGYLKFPKTKSVWLKVITSGKFPEFHISIDDAIGNTSVFYVEDKNAPKLVSISNNNGSFVNYNLTDQNIQRVGEFPESTMVYSKNGIIYVYGAPSTTSVNLRMKATDQSYSSLTDLFDNPNNSFKFVITNDGTYNLSANTIMTKSVSTTKTGGESYFFKLRDCYNIESNQVSIKSYKVEVTNDTTYPWVNYSTERNKGNYSLSAGNLGIHTSSSSITYKTTATSISFDCNVISESNYDKLELIVDGLAKTTISGNTSGWTTRKVTGLSNGIHTFTWKFSKDGSTTADNEKCLIDNIIFE